MSRKDEIKTNLERTLAAIARLADAAGVAAPQLLPVTKFHPAEDVALLAELGVTDVAENREQEARAKAEQIPQLRFHMIGQIQSKKANHVARWAHSVHSLDSVKLAEGLDRGVRLALKRGERDSKTEDGTVLPVFIQISYDGDTSRGGIARENLDELVDAVEALEHLRLTGLMVVPPLDTDAGEVFAAVRGLADAVGDRLGRAMKLSAGMSADLPAAIAAGTDIVRVGTGVMGPRPLG